MINPNAVPETESGAEADGVLLRYIETLRAELDSRWNLWKIDLTQHWEREVVGALLARHVSIGTNLARSPGIWNPHIAPVILRTLSDAYITLAWILKDPPDRAQRFVRYGLGQVKLGIEWYEHDVKAKGGNPDTDLELNRMKKWLDSQRYSWLTEVNVGNWAGGTTREMALDAGCQDAYQNCYVPNSAATHNMWHHVVFHNLAECKSPLHRYHRIPIDRNLDPNIRYFLQGAAIIDEALKLFDTKYGVTCPVESAYRILLSDFDRLFAENSDGNEPNRSVADDNA